MRDANKIQSKATNNPDGRQSSLTGCAADGSNDPVLLRTLEDTTSSSSCSPGGYDLRETVEESLALKQDHEAAEAGGAAEDPVRKEYVNDHVARQHGEQPADDVGPAPDAMRKAKPLGLRADARCCDRYRTADYQEGYRSTVQTIRCFRYKKCLRHSVGDEELEEPHVVSPGPVEQDARERAADAECEGQEEGVCEHGEPSFGWLN